MSRGVEDVHEEALVSDVLHDQRDGSGLDAETPFTLSQQSVRVAHWDILLAPEREKHRLYGTVYPSLAWK